MKKKHIGKKRNPKRKGFTLVELLGAILILAIISGIAIFSYSSIVNKSKTEVFKVYEHTMYSETIALLTDYVEMIPKNNETKLFSLADIGIDPIINPRNKNDLCLNSYVKVTRNDYDDDVHVDGFTYKVCLICLDSNYISDEENCGIVPLPSNTPKPKLLNATNSVEITGTVAYGETLTANVTTNSNGVISYQWYSNTIQSTSDGTEIPGATGSTYTIGSGLTGKYIYVKSSVAASKKYKRAQDAFAITETAIGKKNNVINVTTPETWETTYSTSNQTKEITEVTGARGNVTYEIYSQKNSEEVDINNFTISGRTITMEGNTGAGNYTLVVRATDEGNNEYASAFGDITVNVTVAKANSTITCNETQDYTGSAITAYSASTGCSSYTNGTPTDAGTYTVTCVGDANHNNSTCEFIINKKTLTVTADNKSKYQSQENPSFTYTYSGQVSGQTPDFSGSLTTTATTSSEIGTYDITQGTLSLANGTNFNASNYSISYVSGTLTINDPCTSKSLNCEGVNYGACSVTYTHQTGTKTRTCPYYSNYVSGYQCGTGTDSQSCNGATVVKSKQISINATSSSNTFSTGVSGTLYSASATNGTVSCSSISSCTVSSMSGTVPSNATTCEIVVGSLVVETYGNTPSILYAGGYCYYRVGNGAKFSSLSDCASKSAPQEGGGRCPSKETHATNNKQYCHSVDPCYRAGQESYNGGVRCVCYGRKKASSNKYYSSVVTIQYY